MISRVFSIKPNNTKNTFYLNHREFLTRTKQEHETHSFHLLRPKRIEPQRDLDLLALYGELVTKGNLSHDPQQELALSHLSRLSHDLHHYEQSPPPPMLDFPPPSSLVRKSSKRRPNLLSFFSDLFPNISSKHISSQNQPKNRPSNSSIGEDPFQPGKILYGPPNPAPKGIYFHGPVGVGKSLVMDLFFDSVKLPHPKKRRVHFHDFMNEIHTKYMAQWRAVRNDWNSDPLGSVARSIAAETTLLCFDELHITDLVSALFLSRLFTELFYLGVIIVTTSNKPLDQLWDSGPALHRDPVISTLNRAWQLHANVFEFHPKQDYRRSKPLNLDSFLNLEKRQDANKHLLRRFFSTKPCETAEEIQIFASPTRYISLRLLGRNGLATFDQLCGKPYGTAEYAALAESLDTLFLLDVPKFDDHNLGEGRRFILLIDQLYERRVALSISARADLTSMFDFSFLRNSERETHRFEEAVDDRTKLTSNSDPIVTHFDSSETAFMFNRAVSRIHELTSLNSSNKELGKK